MFLFEEQQPKMGKAARDFERDSESHDATADDDCVVPRSGHWS
jgi:hypothetical protein